MRRLFTRGKLRGQSIIEFALILPLILLLVGGGCDFGLFMFEREQAGSCVRAVARRAAVRTASPASTTAVPQCARAAGKTTISITYEVGATSYSAATAPNGSDVTVSVDYAYPAIFLSLALPINNTRFTPLAMRVKATSTMRMEGQP